MGKGIGNHESLKAMLAGKFRTEIERALPADCGIDADTFCRQIETAFRQNKDLYACTAGAVQQAIIVAAQVGLELNTKKGHAFLTPRLSKKTGNTACVYIQGWRGLMHLARKSGIVTSVNAQIIYANEKYHVQQGTDPRVDHTQNLDPDKRGKPIAAYAVLFQTVAPPVVEVMPWADILDIKNRCGGFLWKDNEGEMGRKTPVRRAFKYGPDGLLPDASYRALALEDNEVYGSPEKRIAQATAETEDDFAAALDDAGGGGDDPAPTAEPEPSSTAPAPPASDYSGLDDGTLAAMIKGAQADIEEARSFGVPPDDAQLAKGKRELAGLLAEKARRNE